MAGLSSPIAKDSKASVYSCNNRSDYSPETLSARVGDSVLGPCLPYLFEEKKTDQADERPPAPGIDLGPGRDERPQESGIDLVVDHHEVAPLGPQEDGHAGNQSSTIASASISTSMTGSMSR